MQQLIPRKRLSEATLTGLGEMPVVALLGPRQVGKTTLATQVAAAWPRPSRVFDLEVFAAREALTQSPDTVLRG